MRSSDPLFDRGDNHRGPGEGGAPAPRPRHRGGRRVDGPHKNALKASGAGAIVSRHERNRGKGAALRSGLLLALESGHEWAVTLDGDGQHAPDELPSFLDWARADAARGWWVGNRMRRTRRQSPGCAAK